jgi:hypothetical protein
VGSAAKTVITLFTGWALPGAVLALITATSGLVGVGADAYLDGSTPIHIGPLTTSRLLHSALGATFLGHAAALGIIVLVFVLFRAQSAVARLVPLTGCAVLMAILAWSGTRTALISGWASACGSLLLFSIVTKQASVRRRGLFALVILLILPLGVGSQVWQFIARTGGDGDASLSDLLQSQRGAYIDNSLRWVGDGSYDEMWGAGLGANTMITRGIISTSTRQRDSAYGLIEPFFSLVKFEWGWAGAPLYAAYWIWLGWTVARRDLRAVRRREPWAGLATCWLLYVWTSSITSFAFGIVNTLGLVMFVLLRVSTRAASEAGSRVPGRFSAYSNRRAPVGSGPWVGIRARSDSPNRVNSFKSSHECWTGRA